MKTTENTTKKTVRKAEDTTNKTGTKRYKSCTVPIGRYCSKHDCTHKTTIKLADNHDYTNRDYTKTPAKEGKTCVAIAFSPHEDSDCPSNAGTKKVKIKITRKMQEELNEIARKAGLPETPVDELELEAIIG